MSENTPQSPYEPNPGGPTPPPSASGSAQPPAYGGAGQLPAYGGAAQPPAYGGTGQPPAYGGPVESYGTQTSGQFRVGEALGFGWNRFKANWLFWVLYVLLTFVVGTIFNAGSFDDYQELNEAVTRGDISSSAATGMTFGDSLLQLIGSIITSVLTALGINAALREVSGEKATWGTLFKVNSYGMIILAALLLAAASFVGVLLCGLGLLAVAIFGVFTYHNVVDKGMNAWAAFTSSFSQVGKNFGAVFLLELAVVGLWILGTIPFLLGLLIVIPLTTIALAFAYRRITGGPVATVAS
jgi:uncharacterized membrane protein